MDFCGSRTLFFALWVLLHSGFSMDGKLPGRLLPIFDLGSDGISFLCFRNPSKLRGRTFRAKRGGIGSEGVEEVDISSAKLLHTFFKGYGLEGSAFGSGKSYDI
jgi:hypothetical protein